MKLENKLFCVFLIFLIVLFGFFLNNSVFASDTAGGGLVDISWLPYIPKEYADKDYIIVSDATHYYICFLTDYSGKDGDCYIDGVRLYFKNSEGGNGTWIGYRTSKSEPTSWVYNFTHTYGIDRATGFDYVGSTVNIYQGNTVFFQKTLLLGKEVILTTAVEQVPGAITQLLRLIIPLGLIILSGLLVISLVRLVISRVI